MENCLTDTDGKYKDKRDETQRPALDTENLNLFIEKN